MKRIFKSFVIIASAWAWLLGACGCDQGYESLEGVVWNTQYHITYKSQAGSAGVAALHDSVERVFGEVGRSVSVFDSQSLVSALNAGDSVKCDRWLGEVWLGSDKVWRLSGGRFDPTLSPLIDAWGFGRGHEVSSDTARVDSLMQFVGWAKCRLSDGWIVKSDRRMQFNFSAIAKGLGCDAVGEMLERQGIENYLVEIGGEIAVKGVSPSGGKWKIGIDRPIMDASGGHRELQEVIGVSDCGVATSGNYRNFHTFGGQVRGHTIDAAAGRPAETDVASATVVAPSCMEADALATACMAMGFDAAKSMIIQHNIPALLIRFDGSIWRSPEMSLIENSQK